MRFWIVMTPVFVHNAGQSFYNAIGIKNGFPYINICQVPREVLKTEFEDRGF